MQEEEAHQEEVIFQEQEEEEGDDAEIEEEECGDVEPSGPQGVAGTEDIPLLDPTGDAVSPEEDTFLMSRHPNPQIQPMDLTAPGVRAVQSLGRWPI